MTAEWSCQQLRRSLQENTLACKHTQTIWSPTSCMYSGYMHDAVIGRGDLLTIKHGKECWRRAEPGRQAENAGADARSSSLRTSFRQTHQQIGKWNVLNKRGARRTQKLASKSSKIRLGGQKM